VNPSDQVSLLPEDGNRTKMYTGWLALYPWSDIGVDFFIYRYFADDRCIYFGNKKIWPYRRVQGVIREKLEVS
jgi:hypothetical protein